MDPDLKLHEILTRRSQSGTSHISKREGQNTVSSAVDWKLVHQYADGLSFGLCTQSDTTPFAAIPVK